MRYFPADLKVLWMIPDSYYRPLVFTKTLFVPEVMDHVIPQIGLQPTTIYKFRIISENSEGTAVDTGYFITQSTSSEYMEAYFK